MTGDDVGGTEPAAVRTVRWRARSEPLQAVAVAAIGRSAAALARTLALRDVAHLDGLSHTWGNSHLLIVGSAASLPWADGVIYLGAEPTTPRLLIPTCQEPDLPLPLFERTLRRRLGNPTGRLAVVPRLRSVIDASKLTPLSRRALEQLRRPLDPG